MPRSFKRFFTSQTLDARLKELALAPEETHHLSHVLRLKSNDECTLFDSKGHEWRAKVIEIKNQSARIELIEPIQEMSPSARELVIAQAIPQRAKMDEMVEKAAELGVSRLIPIVTERTIVRVKVDDETRVFARWARILQEARKQSKSRIPTEISKPVAFKRLFEEVGVDELIFLFDPKADESFPDILNGLKKEKSERSVYVFIGPEGGFTENECKFAREKGARLVKLGNNILKTDTAFVVIASAFRLFLS